MPMDAVKYLKGKRMNLEDIAKIFGISTLAMSIRLSKF
jgi:predicted DNA binding protein